MPTLASKKSLSLANGDGTDMTVPLDERTLSQVVIGGEQEELEKQPTTSGEFYKKVRLMRKHPTIRLARALAIAPLLASQWSTESSENAPEGAKEFVNSEMIPLRTHLLKTSLEGCSDYGWQPYEKVFQPRDRGEFAGKIGIKKAKPLLQDFTKILIDPANGSYAGLVNEVGSDPVTLGIPESLLISIDVEGTDWYGNPDMSAVEKPFNEWQLCNNANIKYDKKIAGAHWVIHYPPGSTIYNGVPTPNQIIAQSLLNTLESSGSFIVPRVVESHIDDLNKDNQAWIIELKGAYPTAGAAFIERLKYIDTLFPRAYILPERAILEGRFGTKAEAEAHGDFAITYMELRHLFMTQQYNWHLVNHLLRINYGPDAEGTVWIKVAPITDLKLQYLREIYKQLLSTPELGVQESDSIDTKGMKEQLGIPILTPEQRAKRDQEEADSALDRFTGDLVPAAV